VEERKAMADYGSSDSGASLGDILGAAIRKAEGDDDTGGDAGADAEAESGEDKPE